MVEHNESGSSEPVASVTVPPADARQQSFRTKLANWMWLIRTAVQAVAVVGVVALLLFLVGLAQRSGWVTADGFGSSAADSSVEQGSENTRYICPMMCTPPSTEPGRCPVCAMELVPATASGGGDGISVTIEAAARRIVGIQTAVAKLGPMTRTIRAIGSIEYDETKVSTISAYVDGRLEAMQADYVGAKVEQGDDLALLYSPQLYSAQSEYVASLQASQNTRFSLGDSGLAGMAREKLIELGMTPSQIETLRKSGQPEPRLSIKSPQRGTVIERAAVEGDYVKTGQKLFQIADLSSVWLMLDLFPSDVAFIRFGQQVDTEVQSLPGEVFVGRVAFIDPVVNPRTRTIRVRVEMLNFEGKLRPGDYASAEITVPATPQELVYDPALAGKYISPAHPQVIRDEPGACPLCGKELVPTSELGYATDSQLKVQVVTVPRGAVLRTGGSGVIYVETEPGRFEIRRVTLGAMNDTEAMVIAGLSAGETVATAGNFLIDSQMQLAGNPSLLDPSKAPTFAPGPLEVPHGDPLMLAGSASEEFDRAYQAYDEIQAALAADTVPAPFTLNSLLAALTQLELAPDVPDVAQREFATARRAAERMSGPLEATRIANRTVSHALLKAATVARGQQTAENLNHYYCPMVPGGGGDWLQMKGELANPYWGEEMLRCGELVNDMGLKVQADQQAIELVPTSGAPQ